jgi:hypothetical protein
MFVSREIVRVVSGIRTLSRRVLTTRAVIVIVFPLFTVLRSKMFAHSTQTAYTSTIVHVCGFFSTSLVPLSQEEQRLSGRKHYLVESPESFWLLSE